MDKSLTQLIEETVEEVCFKICKTFLLLLQDKAVNMAKLTQKERIYRHLIDYGTINPIEALSDYGIMRLASRISDLKKDGVPIRKEMVSHRNRYGEKVHFAKYSLK